MGNSRRFRKNIIFLGLTSFFTDISSEMIYPLLPTFLFSTLGLSRTFIGVIEGISEAFSSLLKFFSGWLSDQIKKRKLLAIFGYSLSNLSKPFFSVAKSGFEALSVRFLDRCGKGIRTAPRDALISLSAPEKERGKYFGIHRTLDTLGAVVGPLLAFLLLPSVKYDSRKIFLFSIFPGILALLILAFLVKETQEKRSSFRFSPGKPSPNFFYFLAVIFIFSLGNSSDAFLLLKAKFSGIPLNLLPLLWLTFNLSYASCGIPAGLLSDRIGRKKVLEYSFILYSLVYLGFAFLNSPFIIWLLFLVYGLFHGLSDGNLRAWVGDMVKKEGVGTAYGLYHTLNGTALFLSSFLMGFLWDKWGSQPAFLLGSSLGGLAFFLLLIRKEL